MYLYDSIDQRLVEQRVAQFRDQTQRFLAGQISADDFKSLRLRNGLYIQKHAPMLRISVPYGLMESKQLRVLARIAREYDRDYGVLTGVIENLQVEDAVDHFGRDQRVRDAYDLALQRQSQRRKTEACNTGW